MKRTYLLLIVAAILTALALQFSYSPCASISKSRIAKAHADASALSMAVRSFSLENGRLPQQLEELTNGKGAYLPKGIPKDPWGSRYALKTSTNIAFHIISAGPDLKFGNEDDIVDFRK